MASVDLRYVVVPYSKISSHKGTAHENCQRCNSFLLADSALIAPSVPAKYPAVRPPLLHRWWNVRFPVARLASPL